MVNNEKTIDSHVHLDLIEQYHPDRIKWLKENKCSVVSWSYFENVDSVSTLKKALQSKADCIGNHWKEGLSCHYLTGVHPRSIPGDLKPEAVRSYLDDYLNDPLCRGIGEIGLETGDVKEQEIFTAQLELGRSLIGTGKTIGIHTPRSNKRKITKLTLKILTGFPEIASFLVVDHCTLETINDVFKAGFQAGVTLSAAKTSWDEMKTIVSMYPEQLNDIMCNTDSSTTFYEDVVRFRTSKDLPEHSRQKIFYGNAKTFFSLERT